MTKVPADLLSSSNLLFAPKEAALRDFSSENSTDRSLPKQPEAPKEINYSHVSTKYPVFVHISGKYVP